MKNIYCILLCLFALQAVAQEPTVGNIRLGQWKSHLPYSKGVSVSQSPTTVYFATDQSIFSVDKEEHSIQLFNKVSGLSDAGMRKVKYYKDAANAEFDALLIAYENSNLDLLTSNGIINLDDIQRKSITGDKKINHIYMERQFAWLSCGFGIVKLDMVNREFKLTTFTDFAVNSIAVYNDKIYASTDNGLYAVDNDESLNLTDFGNWTKLGVNQSLPASFYSDVSTVFQGKLYAGVNDSLYVYDGAGWSFFYHDDLYQIYNIYPSPTIMVCNAKFVGRDKILLMPPNGEPFVYSNTELSGNNPESIMDESGNLWTSDEFIGNILLETGQPVKKFEIEGPLRIDVGAMTVVDSELWIATSNLEPKWNFLEKGFGFASFIENDWTTYPNLGALGPVYDMNSIVVNPTTKNVYIGSFKGGLVEFDRENMTIYNDTNSTLSNSVADMGSIRVSGLAFDEQDNLWVSNYLSATPVNVLSAEGTWHSFTPNGNLTQLTDVVVDDNGYKWFATNSSGIIVYDSGEDIATSVGDRWKVINSSNSALETNEIRSLQVDLDGFVWVGTDEGPYLFDCPALVFENTCPGRRPIAQEGGIDDLLLGTESINAIAVDGANRKWFGTNNGLFILETDANEAEFSFDTENSPLFDNVIVSLAIDGKSGEVYIGTEKGIISYRSNATDGATFFKKDDVYAFPNPVRPDFTGEIAIKGLVTDADVKITDVAGTLIYETTALGGQAVWNGYDYTGRRAATGVYLVFATSRDGLERLVTKLLFVN